MDSLIALVVLQILASTQIMIIRGEDIISLTAVTLPHNSALLMCSIVDETCSKSCNSGVMFKKNATKICSVRSCSGTTNQPDNTYQHYRCGCLGGDVRNTYFHIFNIRDTEDFVNWSCECLDEESCVSSFINMGNVPDASIVNIERAVLANSGGQPMVIAILILICIVLSMNVLILWKTFFYTRQDHGKYQEENHMLSGDRNNDLQGLQTSLDSLTETYKKLLNNVVDRLPPESVLEYEKLKGSREVPDWCHCQNCRVMPTPIERLCCVKTAGSLTCNTLSRAFNDLCLDREHLMKDIENLSKRVDDMSDLRYLAYSNYVKWRHGEEGIKTHGIILVPSCCVLKIRETFPDPKGHYSHGFRGFVEGYGLQR